jgi:uncharacterized protein YndB with AHSA1/START domain
MSAEGTLIEVDGGPALRFERRYRQGVERVWRAVTEPEEMAQWFPSNVEGERSEGAELAFVDDTQRAAARQAGRPTRADGPIFGGLVIVYDPPNRFVFTWAGERLHIELTPDEDGTRLTFTHVLSHESVAARNGAGWHSCLAALDRLMGLAEPEIDPFAVYDDYVDRLGPSIGVSFGDGAMTWERATHVDADRVRSAVNDPTEITQWADGNVDARPLQWEVEPVEHGTIYRLTHRDAGDDPGLAATWHARLLQLDMYLAAGEAIPADPERFTARYRTDVPA